LNAIDSTAGGRPSQRLLSAKSTVAGRGLVVREKTCTLVVVEIE
jgi:hypothetical protein